MMKRDLIVFEHERITPEPNKDAKYTIMVVLEKDGLPASAGGMCGPLFSMIVDGLLLN